MIVYDDRGRTSTGHDAWRDAHLRVARSDAECTPDTLTAALIAFGELESGVADALCPARDDWQPLLARLREISETLGAACAAAAEDDTPHARGLARTAVVTSEALAAIDWPPVRLRTPEGYAYYGLYPEAYADAVVRWAADVRPERVVCLGLRSIGTSLSAMAAGALRRHGFNVRSWTVRPRGHPFDRRVVLAPDLLSRLALWESTVLVVDEGPGLSGSSLTGAAAAIAAAGVPDERILFVPAWRPEAERFVSSAAAARWARHGAIVPAFDIVRRALVCAGVVPADATEISAGEWRRRLHLAPPWPAAHPQHERRKFLFQTNGVRPPANLAIARFAGLGRYGEETARRAAALSAAGWTTPPVRFARGFLAQEFAAGEPVDASRVTEAFVRHASRYVAWLRRHASCSDAAPVERLAEMLVCNTQETLGREWIQAAETLARDASRFDEPATAVDGRLQPHEWIATRAGWIKTDALDHHRDHFFPGPVDAAWDVAGLAIELTAGTPCGPLANDVARFVLDEYVRVSGDTRLAARLPFYTAAYCAFRSGYCSLAAGTLRGTGDAPRFDALAAAYRRRLQATLTSARGAPSAR